MIYAVLFPQFRNTNNTKLTPIADEENAMKPANRKTKFECK